MNAELGRINQSYASTAGTAHYGTAKEFEHQAFSFLIVLFCIFLSNVEEPWITRPRAIGSSRIDK
jgi:hypothetical protein